MPAELRIRRWRAGDAEATLRLFRDTVQAVNSRDYTAEQVAAWASESITLQDWRRRLEDCEAWVAEQGSATAGFISLTATGHIDQLFVGKNRQGQGIASFLLTELEAAARQKGLPELSTDASITARPFFEARGFRTQVEQEVDLRGQSFRNYRMAKTLA